VQMLLGGDAAQFGDPIGLGPHLSLGLVAFAEFGCALLVMVGLATRLAAVPIVVAMGVAAFVAHAKDPWTMGPGPSKEPALLFLTWALALGFTGAGTLSLDGLIGARRSRRSPA
jgi:putative oxidoreductase